MVALDKNDKSSRKRPPDKAGDIVIILSDTQPQLSELIPILQAEYVFQFVIYKILIQHIDCFAKNFNNNSLLVIMVYSLLHSIVLSYYFVLTLSTSPETAIGYKMIIINDTPQQQYSASLY